MRGVGVFRGVVCALAVWSMACSERQPEPSTAPGYAQLHQAVFAESCAQAACHSGASGLAGLSFDDPQKAYERLVGGVPINQFASSAGLELVKAGDPQGSFLLHKMTWSQAQLTEAEYGGVMPLSVPKVPGPRAIEAIEAWIAAGAPYEGAEVEADFVEPDTSVYVACEGATDAAALQACHAAPDDDRALRVYSPPITVPPQQEVTVCSYLPVIAEQDIMIKAAEGKQMKGGHHAAMFVAVQPNGDPAPHECTIEEMSNLRFTAGAGGAGGNATVFPPGVAVVIEQGQQLVMQSHYINTSDEPIVVMDAVDLVYTTPEESPTRIDPFALLYDEPDVPANTMGFSRETVCEMDRDYDVYMLLGHTHENGVLFQVHHEPSGTEESHLLYHATDGKLLREDPDITMYDDPLKLKKGDKLRMTCTWDNTTDEVLGWPEEMCVALMYYGPGEGWLTCDQEDGSPGSKGGEGCVDVEAPGNEIGVGKACTREARGVECRGNGQATQCLGVFDDRANFCTYFGCETDEECGAGAVCAERQGSKLCLPLSCAGDDGE